MRNEWGAAWLVAFLAVLATAIRIQYAPLALVLLGVFFLRSGAWVQVVLVAVLPFLAVGAFDGVTWGGKPFHSYVSYFLFHLNYQRPLSDTMPGPSTCRSSSLAGILNVLPSQNKVYSSENPFPFGFVRNQGTIFSAYRYLAHAPEVKAVWQVDRLYSGTPGYYYLHRKIPFYDFLTGQGNNLHKDLKTLHASVSHLVTEDPNLAVPGYAVEKEFGDVRILRREDNEAPIRRWQNFAPVIDVYGKKLMRRLYPDAPPNRLISTSASLNRSEEHGKQTKRRRERRDGKSTPAAHVQGSRV